MLLLVPTAAILTVDRCRRLEPFGPRSAVLPNMQSTSVRIDRTTHQELR
jgi:hypothetical protein